MSEGDAEILPLRIVARQLGVPAAWLKAECAAGRVPALNAGGRYLANPDTVQRALADRAKQPQRTEAAHA